VTTHFTDEGIKVTYSLLGTLEAVEVFGQADIWRGNFEALAEADAYAKLTKFTYGTQVETERRVTLIGKSISNAQQKMTDDRRAIPALEYSDKELESDPVKAAQGPSSTAMRDARSVNEATVTTLTSITAKGRLLGVRKVRDAQQDGGKIYVAVYRWSVKDADAANVLVNTALELVHDNQRRMTLSENISTLAIRNSANVIAKEVLKLIKSN
jgi:hypothetical protein